MRLTLFLLGGLFLLFSFKQSDSDEILWESGKKLTWEDFKGMPDSTNRHSAVTDCRIKMDYYSKKDTLFVSVKAIVVPSESWVRKKSKNTVLLKHEQVHFDITELNARKLRREILLLNVKKEFVVNEISKIKKEIEQKLNSDHQRYDSETNHCRNSKKQLQWERSIDKELHTLNSFRNIELKLILK